MRTRWLAALLLLFAAAPARGEDPFKGTKTKVLKGPENHVSVTVPHHWRPQPLSGTIVLRALAPGAYGGHDLLIVRESGQSDVDKQRDRYIEYDGGKYLGGEFKKYTTPFFGYRMNDEAKNKVVVRSFVTDGSDGLVISVSSRFKAYDEFWASQIAAIVGSVKLSAGGGGGASSQPELMGEKRRVFDPKGLVSLVVPGAWKRLENEEDTELLCLGLKGTRSGPTLRVVDWGANMTAALVVQKIAGQWKRAYAGVTLKRILKPPALLVKNRKVGWIDYIVAFDAGTRGYGLMLSVREGSFERFRSLTEDVAKTLVFMNGAYEPAEKMPGDLTVDHKSVVVHVRAEDHSAGEKIVKEMSGFERAWARIRVNKAQKTPLHVILTDAESFGEVSQGFGEKPAAYDRLRCAVVALPLPSSKTNQPLWRGKLYAALAAAAMHRDMKAAPPPWLHAGLAACMDAAGQTGKGPDEGHPGLTKLLDLKTSTDSHMQLKMVLALTHADLLSDPKNLTMAWGYTSLMNFGGGTLTSIYKKWRKVLEKKKGEAPELDLKKYDRAEEDLKRYVFKNWGK